MSAFKSQPEVSAKYEVLAKNPVLLIPGYGTVDFRKINVQQADKLFNSKNGSRYLQPKVSPEVVATASAEKPAKKTAPKEEVSSGN